jgi:hypothetical protein
MTHSATTLTPADVVPGITGAELQVMLAAATAFQRDRAVISPHAAASITALTAPAPAGGAGLVRARRGEYKWTQQWGHHMRHAATDETGPAPGGIAGITGAELQVMLAAATAFQRDHAVFCPRVAEAMTALTAPAPAGAAGVLRPRRASYLRDNTGHHYMENAG